MNATKANIINSVCLIAIGLWGYLEVISPTALIPGRFWGCFNSLFAWCKKGKQSCCAYSRSFNACHFNCLSRYETYLNQLIKEA